MARSRPSRASDSSETPTRVRLQRVMADAGVAARRACEEMIEAGRVSVNGEVTKRLPVFVDAYADTIIVDGRRLQKPDRKLYLMVYKPERMLVTNADEPEFDRATIMEIVDHPAKARLFPVGRLDFETAGLVLMTNDGEFANALTHPRYNVPKIYEAIIKGQVDQAMLDGVRVKIRGVRKRSSRDEGVEGPVSAGAVPELEFIRHQGGNTIVHVTLLEARNRELREALEFLGMPIKKLTRIGLGGLTLTGVPPANWRELTREEIHLLRRPRGGYVARPKTPRPAAPAAPAAPVMPRNQRVVSRRPDSGETQGGSRGGSQGGRDGRPARGGDRPFPKASRDGRPAPRSGGRGEGRIDGAAGGRGDRPMRPSRPSSGSGSGSASGSGSGGRGSRSADAGSARGPRSGRGGRSRRGPERPSR
jgi:23S rRNA pseudouridine2605 synthase